MRVALYIRQICSVMRRLKISSGYAVRELIGIKGGGTFDSLLRSRDEFEHLGQIRRRDFVFM